jgi:hypothetical protein
MIVDVSLSKYCDLIPIDRYSKIAAREGLGDLPTQTLIEGTHNLADFVAGAFVKVKQEALGSRVLHGDETPHHTECLKETRRRSGSSGVFQTVLPRTLRLGTRALAMLQPSLLQDPVANT